MRYFNSDGVIAVQWCKVLPGKVLIFTYVDPNGERHTLSLWTVVDQ